MKHRKDTDMVTKTARWLAEEPVRMYLYTLVGTVVAVLASYGFLTEQEVVLWLAVASAVLSVPAVEKARSRVTPQFTSNPATPKE